MLFLVFASLRNSARKPKGTYFTCIYSNSIIFNIYIPMCYRQTCREHDDLPLAFVSILLIGTQLSRKTTSFEIRMRPNYHTRICIVCIKVTKDGLKKSSLNKNINVKNCRFITTCKACLLYTSPSPRDRTRSRMPSSA